MSWKYVKITLIVAIVAYAPAGVLARTLHVDPTDSSAYSSIQTAIDSTSHFDTVVVHPGVYQENIDFHGKAVTVTSLDPNDPAVVAETVVDGNGDNVVTFAHGETVFTRMLGLTLRNGAIGVYSNSYDCQPEITNCVISDNSGDGLNGGLPVLTGCTVRDNGGDGLDACSESITGCTITGNGENGIKNHYGDLIDSTVSENGLYGVSCEWTPLANISGCTITGNAQVGVHVMQSGPDVSVSQSIISGHGQHGILTGFSEMTVSNCTVVGNTEDGISAGNSSQIVATNCIVVWNGVGGLVTGEDATLTSTYNCVYGNGDDENYIDTEAGEGDIRQSPWFASNGFWRPGGTWQEGDYHLLSRVGRWDPSTEGWVTDPIDSPCLDMGDPTMPFGEETYPHGGRLNLGAYGGTPQASMSQGDLPQCTSYPVMDFNKDCVVDQADLDIFMEHWLECNLDPNDSCPEG